MASEISWRHSSTGSALYATIRTAARQYWHTDGTPGLETLTVAHWANYVISLAETPASSYFYVGTWPAGLTTAGWYWLDIFSGTGAIGDALVGGMVGWWDGTTFRPWAGDATQIGGTAQTGRDLGASVLLADDQAVNVTKIGGYAVTATGAVAVGAYLGNATHAILVDADGAVKTVDKASGAALAVASLQPAYQPTVDSGGKTAAKIASGDDADAASIKATIGVAGAGLTSVGLAASQHVIVDSGTVTNLTNLPAIPANWLTAAGIAATALNGKGDWSTLATSDIDARLTAFPVQKSNVAVTLPSGVATEAKQDTAKTAIDGIVTTLSALGTLTSNERNAVADALLARANAVDGKTVQQALRIMAAVLAGKVSGAGSGTETFKGLDGTTTRAVVTTDADANRTNVVYS